MGVKSPPFTFTKYRVSYIRPTPPFGWLLKGLKRSCVKSLDWLAILRMCLMPVVEVLFWLEPPPQAESIMLKMTRRVKAITVALLFTLDGIAGRELGVIYNLLPWMNGSVQ